MELSPMHWTSPGYFRYAWMGRYTLSGELPQWAGVALAPSGKRNHSLMLYFLNHYYEYCFFASESVSILFPIDFRFCANGGGC